MSQSTRAARLFFSIVTPLLLVSCTNSPRVQVCDPCGCRCVAAPLIKGCGVIARSESESVPAKPETPSAAAPTEADLPAALEKKQIVGLHFEGATLDAAVSYLRTITGISFFISPKVREERFDDIEITVDLADVSALTVLDVILTEPFGLRWEARDGVIWILTADDTSGPKRLRYFDVKDLVLEERGYGSEAELVEELRREVHPDYWDEAEAIMKIVNGILIVRAAPGVNAALDRYLAGVRREQEHQGISAQTRRLLDETMVSLSVENGSLAEVLKTLQIQTGRNLLLDSRLGAEVGKNRIVGFDLHDVALSTVLNMLAAAAGEDVLWVEKADVLVLTRAELLGQ